MQVQRNAIIAESYREALTLADLAEAIAINTADTTNPIFQAWLAVAGVYEHMQLVAFATTFHTQCALGALRWFRDNATPPTGV